MSIFQNPLAPLKETSCLVIMGRAGAGKDTLARMIQEYMFGTDPRRGLVQLKFAQPLKEACSLIFGWDERRLNDLDYKEERLEQSIGGMTTRREVLQHVGTDVFRSLDSDVWVKAALRRAAGEVFNPGIGFVSTDCRFPNELEALKNAFASVHTVWVSKRDPNIPSGFTCPPAAVHESEAYRPDVEVELDVVEGDMDAMREGARMVAHMFYMKLLKESA